MSIQGEVVQVAIDQVKGFLSPTDAERAAAFELLVELSTRTTTAQLASTEGSLREALDSIHAMFEITRQVLRAHGVDSAKGSGGNLSLAVISVRVLNEVFRPTLSKWHPLLADHEHRRRFQTRRSTPIEWERTWMRHAQCRSELNELRASVRAYIDTLSRIAGAPAIGDAVLAPPTSTMMRREVLTSSRHPSHPDAAGLAPRTQMVRWLHPVEMFKTWRSAFLVPKSVGGNQRTQKNTQTPAPARASTAASSPTAAFLASKDTDFWFDYVADMGDGFDGTAPVAWMMGRHQLELPDDRSGELPTPPASMPRPQLVVFGGDEVYPFAAEGCYESQTELPFEMGLEWDPKTDQNLDAAARTDASDVMANADLDDPDVPTLVAIPGNHDWLGGIEHFIKAFTKRERPFAGHWHMPQTELYWHVQLPQGWWLWGIDTGLENKWPDKQVDYFTMAAEQLVPGDRVILCSPVPLWQLRQKYPEAYIELRSSLDRLIEVSGVTMPLCLSGDSHYFAHFERVDGGFDEDHITAGGGGAFLQPTHNLPERIPLERANAEFKLTSRWPRPADSRALAPGARRLFERQYWPLMALGGVLHLAFIALAAIPWAVLPWSPDCSMDDPCDGWLDALAGVLGQPLALLLLVVVTYSGVIALRGNSIEPKLQKAAQGYGLLIGGAVSASIVAVAVVRRVIDPSVSWIGIVASAVVGGVLSIALFLGLIRWTNRRIKAADTLAFSPAYSTRFKHFLRFRIGCDGDLTCYVVGLDPVGVGWYEAMTDKLIVPPHDPAGIPRVHYVWGKTYRKFVPRPIDIALSVSNPPVDIFNSYALSATNLDRLFVDLSQELIEGGHTVMYGGTPKQGYTKQLDEIDRRLHANNPNAGPHLINYVSEYQQPADSESAQDVVSSGAKTRTIVVTRRREPDETDVVTRVRDDTAMRRRMTTDAHLRIVIGGNTEPGEQQSRIAPGIVEEAYQAIEAGLPLLVAGGSGGAAALIADALLHRSDHAELDRLANRLVAPGDESDAAPDVGFMEMMRSFNSLGQLGNGLTDGENRELLTTTDPDTILRLVMRSVSRIAEQHEH